MHRARKSYSHRPDNPVLVRLRLEPAKGPDLLESIALPFLDSVGEKEASSLKLDSFNSNPWGLGLEACPLKLGSRQNLLSTDKKKIHNGTLTITIPLGEGCIDNHK